MTKLIELTQGKQAIVDDADFEWLNQWKWNVQKSLNTYYAKRIQNFNDGTQREVHIYMHRLIMNTPIGMVTDHINRNGLDNRRSNLRKATQSQNTSNAKLRIDNRNGLIGVYKKFNHGKFRNKWGAQIRVRKQQIHLGYFSSPEDAAKARDQAALKYFGEFSRLNFTIEGKNEN